MRRGWPRCRRWSPALLTVAFVATGLGVDTFGARHPVPVQLMYALDTDTGQARWVSTDTDAPAWSQQYVTGTAKLGTEFPPLGTDALGTGPAQAADLPAPTVTVVSDSTSGGQRHLTFTVKPQRAVRLAYLQLDGAKVLSRDRRRPGRAGRGPRLALRRAVPRTAGRRPGGDRSCWRSPVR